MATLGGGVGAPVLSLPVRVSGRQAPLQFWSLIIS